MAFMVPVVKNEWDLYGSSPRSREQAKRAARSRTMSEASTVSRGPSFTRQQTPLSSSPLVEGPWCTARPGRSSNSRSSSRGSNLSSLATSPPPRAVKFAPCVAHSQPSSVPQKPTPAAATSQPSSFSGLMERMMRALHRSDGRDSGRSVA